MARAKLTSARAEELSLVSRAAFSNPFGDIRDRLDIKIAGADHEVSSEELLAKVIHRIERMVRDIGLGESCRCSDFSDLERPLVQNLILFLVFHKYMRAFDDYISQQVSRKASKLDVTFADDCYAELDNYGIPAKDFDKYFAIFFQLRRAYYFLKNDIIGAGPSTRKLRSQLWRNIFTIDPNLYLDVLWDRMEDFSTLLLGPTGCGKGLVASAIGRSGFIPFNAKTRTFSESFVDAFVEINLSQYPSALIESELFGHRKGAFTGAIDQHEGIFARCSSHGAIFLDEIGDVSIPVQVKLLRVLQSRTFSPVGSHESLRFNGRIIAATNKPLHRLRQAGEFRDDFFYRLSSDVITIPSLSQRLTEHPDELRELIESVMARLVAVPEKGLTDRVHGMIKRSVPKNYHWPGNVRELEQAVRSVLINGHYRPQSGSYAEGDEIYERLRTGALRASGLLSHYCRQLYQDLGSYEQVAKTLDMDRRTVKKYAEQEDDA